jgi:hypothetical protein
MTINVVQAVITRLGPFHNRTLPIVLKNNIDHQNALLATVEGVKLLVHTYNEEQVHLWNVSTWSLENDLKLEDLINRFEKYFTFEDRTRYCVRCRKLYTK